MESPTQRLILEFSQMLLRSDEAFTKNLDKTAAESAQTYQQQLLKAADEHEKVRTEAELEQKRLVEEQEAQQREREEKIRRDLERLEAEKAREARERELEAKKREAEAARQAAEHQRKLQEAEAKARAQRDEEEAAQRKEQQREKEARKAQAAAEAAKAKANALKQPVPPAQAPSTVPVSSLLTSSKPAAAPTSTPSPAASAGAPPSADVEIIHTKYMELHRRMKEFWKPFKKECATPGNPMKALVGDLRRDMRKCISQVSVSRQDSKVIIQKLRAIFATARNAGGPTVDIRPFVISRDIPPLSADEQAQYPAILLYAFICFEKFVIKQFANEAANDDGRVTNELGVIAASLMMDKDLIWNGVPLVDLLLAKYHSACPILFGVHGDMKNVEGMRRLGCISAGEQLQLNDYHQRMLGLGCGFAAMSLRAVASPAIPMSEYWRALSRLCNTPVDAIYSGHFYVLKGLVRDQAKKFIMLYGVPGKALLRHAVTVLPKRAPARAKAAAGIASVLPDTWKAQGISIA